MKSPRSLHTADHKLGKVHSCAMDEVFGEERINFYLSRQSFSFTLVFVPANRLF